MSWYRSPSGVLSHADGPSQQRAYTDRGYTPVDDAAARRLIGEGVELTVDPADSTGTFDAAAVEKAVAEEGSQAAARSAAAKKAAATRRRNKAAAGTQPAAVLPSVEPDAPAPEV